MIHPYQIQCDLCLSEKDCCYNLVAGEYFPVGIFHKIRIRRARTLSISENLRMSMLEREAAKPSPMWRYR